MEPITPFRVVIAHETVAAAVRAKEMSQRIAAELKSECSVWDLESLAHLPIAQRAVAEAARADMIIFAVENGEDLPAHVKGWIENWLVQKENHPSALVALLEMREELQNRPLPLCMYLAQVAKRGGMDFFSNVEDGQPRDFENTEEYYPDAKGYEPVRLHAEREDSNSRGWGINE